MVNGQADPRQSDVPFRVLSDLARLLVAESDPTRLLEAIADAVATLIPYDALVLYQADLPMRQLRPVLVRDPRAGELNRHGTVGFGEGVTGFAAEHREAVLSNDPDSRMPAAGDVPPEAVIAVPLLAREELKGMLNLYRMGHGFEEPELDLARRFAELAAFALENAQVRKRLASEIVTDHLTGLYNHRYFQERLAEEMHRSARSGQPVSLVVVDVDDFKVINQTESPLSGDHVLAGLGSLLRGAARPEDVICRIGGEEFAILLPGASAHDAVAMAERLRERIAAAEFNGGRTKLTVSMGVAAGPAHATTATELMSCANNALLQSKGAGKNRVSAYLAGEWSGVRAVPQDRFRMAGQLKVLQSLSSKLNRLLDVSQIGEVLMNELRSLIDYDSFRIYLLDPDGRTLRAIAFAGERPEYSGQTADSLMVEVGQGITGRVAETGESIYAPDADQCEYAVDIPGTPPVDESVLAVPLRFGERAVGAIAVSKLGLGKFDADDLRLLESLGSHVAVALENARLFQKERQAAETANAMLRLSKALTRTRDPHQVMKELVGACSALFDVARVSTWMRDDQGALRCMHAVGPDGDERDRARRVVVSPDVAARYLLSLEEPFYVSQESVRSMPEEIRPATPGPALVAPVRWEPDGVAAIVLAGEPGWRISSRQFGLARGVADLASLALGNATRFADMEKGFLETVEVLANALEAKDAYTHGHARQVAEMSMTVGRELGLGEDEVRMLELAGVFHDIGKIGVATDILNKPAALDDAEWEAMRKHPEIGEQILEPVEFLQPIRPIVRSCHERWDGRGYPDGLSGQSIPLGARVIFVCDAWHAMTSDRAYRKAFPEEEAIRRLEEASGSQFDPTVVRAFLRTHSRGEIAAANQPH